MQLSVIIVNYNVKYFLEQCLCAVQKACINVEAEIFVVDNNSTDGSREYLLPKFPTVNFTWNGTNSGFAKANNQALAAAKGEYVLFLNPDTIVPEDCFEKCMDFFKDNPGTGVLGVHMVDGSGKFLKESKRAFPSPLTSLYKLTGLANLFPHSKIFAKYYLGHLPENKNHEADVLAGAFMMVPREVLTATGSFDEIFFMYGEDVDLSYRVQKAGFKNFYFAATSIIHFKGESTGKGSLNYVRLFYKAMSLFVKKHYSGSRAGIFIFFIQIAILGRALISAIGRIFKGIRLPVTTADDHPLTIIVANEKDFSFIGTLMQKAGMQENILGRVNNKDGDTNGALGNISALSELTKKLYAKEIVFCEDGLGFKAIISTIQQLPGGLHNKFHASGSHSVVGSNSKNENGEYLADDEIAINYTTNHL